MLTSKLPNVGTTIFSRMSALADAHGALNLSQGFPDFGAPPQLCEAMAKHVLAGNNQYAPMVGVAALREQISNQLRRHRGVACDPEREVTVLPGATEAIFCAVMASIDTGDEVIVLDPCYDSYAPSVALAGGTTVHVPLTASSFKPDWQRIHDAVSSRTRMIIINSPHNPTGSIWSNEDMTALETLAERHDLLVVSDEVYEYLVFDGQQHHSVLQRPALRDRSFAVYSFGKTYSVTGWKTGYCVAPVDLTRELRKVHQFVCFVAVTPVQHALAEFMAAQPDYPLTLADFYQHKRDLLCAALAESEFDLIPSDGTYFQLINYSKVSDAHDVDLAEAWVRNQHLAAIPVSPFYDSPVRERLLRLCFAKDDAILKEAAAILCAT